ncbi:hypothetical protein J518_1299 [Acinetobacter baumannii 1419130]|nr:hypothetical protein J518_1299 [Acinetobacter baumannii 1419130]
MNSFTSVFCSWRHTPFRNCQNPKIVPQLSSWRHTPFRKPPPTGLLLIACSWRHTPFRNTGLRYLCIR